MSSCENALANFDKVWLFLSPFLQSIFEKLEIEKPWVRKETQEHGFEIMLITETYTEVNSKAGGQFNMGKDMHCYWPPQVYFLRCLCLCQRFNVKKDLYCLLIDLPSYK